MGRAKEQRLKRQLDPILTLFLSLSFHADLDISLVLG